MKKSLLPFLLLFVIKTIFAQSETDRQVIILGNIADVTKHERFLEQLENRMKGQNNPFIVLLNGDISQQKDDVSDPLALTKKIMDLIQLYPSGNLVITPGDRDWKGSGKGGHKSVVKIEKEIHSYKKKKKYKRINWVLPKGCPGPYIEEVDESFVLIAINTQWWNHPYDKPRPSDGTCEIISHRDFMEELEDAVDENKDKNILIVGHHPFNSLGNYGGHFSFGNRMQPFPIYGSFRVAYRRKVGSAMDITNENLEPYVEGMKNLFFFNKSLIFVSSHEHNQQIVIDNDNFRINAGAIEKGKFSSKDPNAWLSSKNTGWIELSYKSNGAVEALFVTSNQSNSENTSFQLFDSACSSASLGPNEDTPLNLSYAPCHEEKKVPEKMTRAYPPVVKVVAGKEYAASKWKQFWWGKHYRTTWTEPVEVPYLNLDTTFGGLKVYKKGGGRQTTSLKFKSANKTVFVFRSVNKDPSKAFNYKLRPTLVSTVTKDQTSTQHPYGAMAVDPLLDKIDILHASPTLYLLPEDEKLGYFQFRYGNLFGMLEENPSKKNNLGIRFGGADKIVKSNKLFRELYQDKNSKVELSEFVRARNFDILVGDWSKHEDNWKWAKYKNEDGTVFRPIPRDRDHVFSKQDGFWPWIADREWALQNIENFDYKIKGLKSLMWQARHMDRFVATEATREQWVKEAEAIQQSITEADIDSAIQNMPAEIYEISGETISKKLKQRIKDLPKYAEKYYELLADEVDVLGSAEKEYFVIERADDGSVTVTIFERTKDRKKGEKQLYSRKFLPKETSEIKIFGLGGGDVFEIKGERSKSIQIRIFGGSGNDSFFESGSKKSTKTLIYDKGKNSEIALNKGAKIAKEWNKEVYEYDRTRFKYDTYFPLLYLNYSEFNGFTLAGGVQMTKHHYTKDDYAIKFSVVGGVSTKGNLKLVVDSRFHHVFRKWDLLYRIAIADPEFHNNFFGLGNGTMVTESLKNANYYEMQYSKFNIDLGVARDFWRNSQFKLLFSIETTASTKLDAPNILLDILETPGAFQRLYTFPVKGVLDLDFRDEKGLPYNGTRLFLRYNHETVLSEDQDLNTFNNYGIAEGAFEYYISSVNANKVTLGVRIGGAKGYGVIPFYKMPNLGGTNGLRGYTGQRFTGTSKIYFNSELRWQLLHRYTPVFPVKFGVKAFFDTGRVFYTNDSNQNKWHKGYGAGIFIVPFEEAFLISISVGFSEEESFYPIIGFGTPLR